MKRATLIGALAVLCASAPAPATVAVRTPCAAPRVSTAYAARVAGALASGHDVWGEQLLHAAGGPTLAAARKVLPPLLYAAGRGGTRLTESGVYYLPFTLPVSVGGSRGFGLHVADGSEIIVRRFDGPSLTINVGAGGRERYGSCLERLGAPQLAQGYLPLLQVAYRDATGTRYHEESFVGRLPQGRSLVSFVRITADASQARRAATILLATSTGQTLRRVVAPGQTVEVDAAFAHSGPDLLAVNSDTYAAARAGVVAFWQHSLASLPVYSVPEPAVENAARGILIQELELTWRYSVGNAYEELSFAEALDVAQVLTEFGCDDVARQILRYTLKQLPLRFTNWRAGERLVAGAQFFRMSGDRAYVAEETPELASVVERLARQQAANSDGLLPRERYSSDIGDEIYSLQGQTVVLEGLLAMSRVWAATGHTALATQARSLAVRLQGALHRAVHASERRLPDGSLFVPAGLLENATPFRDLTASVAGTYWNLVTPYTLASGFFAPQGPEANGLLRYLELHGSRLLGLVRAGAYRLAGGDTSVSGTDQVYGVNVARFLADNDQPDQLVLSLYGTLAAALTPGTYIAGEAASVTPLHEQRYRTMYLPPNNDGAAAFLETLRLMLVHETRGPEGAPSGLELAFATPRGWLASGRSIVVHNAPTSFGPVGYSISRQASTLHITVDPPPTVPRSLELRLRLPAGDTVEHVSSNAEPIPVDRTTQTLALPRRTTQFTITVTVGSAR